MTAAADTGVSLKERKAEARKNFLAARKSIAPETRRRADKAICERLLSLPETAGAEAVAAYLTDGSEPDLRIFLEAFLKRGGRLCLPRASDSGAGYEMAWAESLDRGIIPGPHGIPEPGPEFPAVSDEGLSRIVWIVPGVAFDSECRRLGRGKGVYDRLLERVKGFSIGVFYEAQKCGAAPSAEHDRRLDAVVTEETVRRRT